IILAVFLVGLAVGSSAGSLLLRTAKSTRSPRLALGWCQILLAAGIAWTAYMIANSLPYWPVNTLGAIVGALGISLIVVPWIGTQQAQRILLLASAASALFVLAPYIKQYQARAMAGWLVVSLVAAVFLATNLDPIPGKLIAYGRRLPISASSSKVLYTAEGINSSVAITQWNDGAIEVDVNGH